MQEQNQEAQKFNFIMVAGQVMFAFKGNKNVVTINALVKQDSELLTQNTLNMAEHGLRSGFIQKLGKDENIELIDIVILSLVPMGRMTMEEFFDRKAVTQEEAEKMVEAANAAADQAERA